MAVLTSCPVGCNETRLGAGWSHTAWLNVSTPLRQNAVARVLADIA